MYQLAAGLGTDASARPSFAADPYLAALPEAVLGVLDGRIAYANARAADLLGADSTDLLLGRAATDLVDPDVDPAAVARLAGLLEADATMAPISFRLRRLDGRLAEAELTRPAFAELGANEVLLFLRDVTAQRSAERSLAAARELAEALAGCDSLDDAFCLLLRAVAGTLQVAQGVVATGQGDAATVLATFGLTGDASAVLAPGASLRDAAGVGQILGLTRLPVALGERELGCLYVGPSGPDGLGGELTAHLRTLTAMGATALARMLEHAAWVEAEARHHAVFHALEHGLMLAEPGRGIVAANAVARRILGLGSQRDGEDLNAACRSLELWREDGRPVPLDERFPSQPEAAGQPHILTLRSAALHGLRSVRVCSSPSADVGAPVTGVTTITVDDVTADRRRAEVAAAQRRIAEFARSHGSRQTLRLALDEAERLTGSRAAVLHLVPAGGSALVLEACSAQFEGHAGPVGARHVPLLADESDPWCAAVSTGEVAVAERRIQPPACPLPVARAVVAPIQRDGQTIALFSVANKPLAYDDVDREAVAALAEEAWTAITQQRLEAAVRAGEERFRRAVDLAGEGIVMLDRDGAITFANDRLKQWLGVADEQLLGSTLLALVHPDDLPAARAAWAERHQGLSTLSELRLIRADGNVVWLQLSAAPLFDANGQFDGSFAVAVDMTERQRYAAEHERLQQQLADARRLETVGQLAGGIAHDLNNVLAPVLGYSELLLGAMADDDPARPDLGEIAAAAERAKQLVLQLLTFARRQALEVKPLHLNAVVNGLLTMLRRTIREDVDVVPQLAAELPVVRADLTQLEQVLLNLVVNAQDAMPDGGRIIVSTEQVQLDSAACRHIPGALPGRYVVLAVADNGCGMDEETRRRAFEPLFTTKAADRGTGLGLATVYGIVKQHSGLIDVESALGRGTTFRCYFRASADAGAAEPGQGAVPTVEPRHPTVLVVDDQLDMLRVAEHVLRRAGYHVIGCTDPRAAIKVANSTAHIDLLLTDLVMPNMNGLTLSRWLVGTHPHLRTLCMTGYASEVANADGEELHDAEFLFKPFTPTDLTDRVRDILARPAVA